MKRKLTILTCFIALCSFAFGQNQDYHWDYIDPNLELNMTITAKVNLDTKDVTSEAIEVAAFCEGELRGREKSIKVGNSYYLYLTVAANDAQEKFYFKFYHHDLGIETTNTEELSYSTEGYGDRKNPHIINFTAPELPNADVLCLGSMTVDVEQYYIYNGNGISSATDEFDLQVAMEFIANDTPEEAASNYYGNYTTDFYITFNGIENGTFEATGCYLAGYYPSFGAWVKVPIDAITIENDVIYPIITTVGFDFRYVDICESVQDFICGIYIAPEILAANPDMTVQLELGLSKDIDAAQAAQFITVDEPYVYDVDVLSGKVAKVGETTYTTLAEAVAAANNEETVELLISAQGSGVVIDKDITIDFGGFTYTFNEGVGSTGTESNGFQILKDNTVVLKNGTLNVAQSAASTFYTIIQNYANLTINDMALDGTNLDKWSSTDGDSYVVSINSGSVNITGKTTIIANNDGDLAFAFDACDQTNKGYSLPVVTVNTTGAINGAVEVSATLNIEALGDGSEISYISIDGKGQLFHNGLKTTIKKHITGDPVPQGNNEYVGGWYTISSPVGDVNHTEVVGLLNGTHDLYRYNEADAMWENVKNTEHSDFTTLEAGRGYIYANTEDTELSFKGTLNTDAVTQNLTASHAELTGFNLIGNPFTYDIALENITGAELASGFYTLTKEGAWGASISSIGACQGALVKTTSASEITINPAAASKRTASENNGALAITVSNAKYSDVAYVSFNEGLGLDKINHRNAEIPMVYIPVDGVNYAVAMMNQEITEIPVSFEAKSMGQYTIGVEAQDCEYAMMTLVDRFTGEETNLLLEDYSFIAKTNDNPERFIIKLALANSNGEANENFAFINNGMMYIYNIEGQGMVNVYDVTGRPVAEYNVATSANISTSDFAAGVYIIRMSDENGVKTQKIVIE